MISEGGSSIVKGLKGKVEKSLEASLVEIKAFVITQEAVCANTAYKRHVTAKCHKLDSPAI